MADLLVRINVAMDQFRAAMAEFNTSLDDAAKKATSAFSGIDKLGSSLVASGVAMSAAVTAPLLGIGVAAVKMSEQLNMANIAFTTMLGSAKEAGDFLNQLKQFAISTPFQFPDVVEGSKRLLALGFAANQVVPALRSIGDATAGLSGGPDLMNRIIHALGEMNISGKVTGITMRELTMNGIAAWQMLAKAIGVDVPTAMKLAESGAITSAQAIPAILAGMNDKFGGLMQQQAQTLTGMWSNFNDSLTLTLAEIGKNLTPALKSFVSAAMPVIGWIKDASEWFSKLPEPVRNGALAFTAIVAAIGPLLLVAGGVATAIASIMSALGPIAAALGITATAFAGWAAVIPIVVAALVALGTWVYENWHEITAVVVQAWSGISDIWGAVWNPIASWLSGVWTGIGGLAQSTWGVIGPYITAVWNPVKSAFESAWNGISSFLANIWGGIKSVAESIWSGIVSTFNSFLAVVAKIPGVNKLMNLDDAWKSAKKLDDQMKANTDSANKANTAHKALGQSIHIVTDEYDKTNAALKPLNYSDEILLAEMDLVAQRHRQAVQDIAKYRLELQDAKDGNDKWAQSIQAAETKLTSLGTELTKYASMDVPAVTQAINDALNAHNGLTTGLQTLGITSATEYAKIAQEAKAAYDAVMGSGVATDFEKNDAMLQMLQAQRAAMIANSQAIPAAMQQTIADLQKKVVDPNTGLPMVQTKFDQFSKNIASTVERGVADMATSLFDGPGSFGDKAMNMLKQLGKDVVEQFTAPFAKAIGQLISGAITDLMGGKGFGGLLDSVKSVGTAITNLFSGASSAAGGVASAAGQATGVAGSAAGTAGQAASGAGSAAGAVAGGVTGIIGAVGSAVSAISGVISNFQMAGMNKSLDLIEHNTRYTMMYVGERADGGILGELFKINDEIAFGFNTKATEAIKDTLSGFSGVYAIKDLDMIQSNTGWTLTKVDEMNNKTSDAVGRLSALVDIGNTIASKIDGMTNSISSMISAVKGNITVNVTGGADAQDTANVIMQTLRAQGVA